MDEIGDQPIEEGTNFQKEAILKRIELLDTENVQQVNFLKNRTYLRDSKKELYYPSVTTILEYVPKNKYFLQWMKEVGTEANRIMRQAAKEGSQVHYAAEDLINGKTVRWKDKDGNAKYSLKVWSMICKFVDFWKTVNPEVIAVEKLIFSDVHEYAGTIDLIVKINEKVYLLDIKTSNTVHRSQELQLAAYCKAWEEQTGQKIEAAGLIWLKASTRTEKFDDKKIQGKGWQVKMLDDINEAFEDFKHVHALFKRDNPTVEPLFNKYPIELSIK